MGDEDRRRWARIEASLECTVAAGEQTFDARVVNVSRSGLAALATPGQAHVGDAVSILLERPEGSISLSLSGKVVRIYGSATETVYGVHFEALPPDSERELVMLLKLLALGRGAGRREHPRVAARIAVRCKSREAFTALLNDLSRGGLSIRCPREVEQGATLGVDFGLEGQGELISIEGTVTHVQTLPDGRHLAGLSFTPPSMARRAQVQQLLDLLLGLAMRQGVIEEDDVEEP